MPISVKISSDLGHFKQCETCVTCGDVWNQRQLYLRTWISAKADNTTWISAFPWSPPASTGQAPYNWKSHDCNEHCGDYNDYDDDGDGYFDVSIDDNDDDYWYDES